MTKPIVDLTREDVKKGLADGSILLVDVREPNEWDAGHIRGLRAVSALHLRARRAARPRGKRIVFSCRSGNRSVTAIRRAQAAGLP